MMSKKERKKFSENEIELVLVNFPDGATPLMILESLNLSWNKLQRGESQSFTSALGRLYRKRKALSLHVYTKFIVENNLSYKIPERSSHTRLIFHKQYESRYEEISKLYFEWAEQQPLATKPYSVGTKYDDRSLDAVRSEPVTYQPRSVTEAKVALERDPTPEEQKAVLFSMFDKKCLNPSSGIFPREISRWTNIDDAIVLKILQMGSKAREEYDKIFDQDIQRRTWFLTTRGKQRVSEIRFGSIDFALDDTLAGICLNKWNRKAIHFLDKGKTIEEMAMTIGYVWDDEKMLPKVARQYAVEEIDRMLKTLSRYGVIRIEQHELMPNMTRVIEIVKEEILQILRYLAVCLEHLQTLFVEDQDTESIIHTLIPKEKMLKPVKSKEYLDLSELLATGFFSSPSMLQLVGKYIPDLSEPDPEAFEKMGDDFVFISKKVEENTQFTIKKTGSRYWLLKKTSLS